jgi:hypothetical protein
VAPEARRLVSKHFRTLRPLRPPFVGSAFGGLSAFARRTWQILWINKDSTAHTVTANNGRSFDSGRLGKGQRYKHTFKRTAKKPYHCEIHPHMKGRITLKR